MRSLIVVVALLVLVPLFKFCAERPTMTIVPIYAFSLPLASVVELNVPLPPPFNTLSSLLGAFLLAAVFVHITVFERARVPSPPVGLWCLFMAWVSLTALWAPSSGKAMQGLMIAVPLVMVMIAFSLLNWSRRDIDVLRLAIVISGLVVGAYALYLLVSGAGLPSHGVNARFSVTSDAEDTDPNILAASLLLPMAMALEMFVHTRITWWSRRTSRWIGGCALILTLFAIIATGSRGGLLGSFAAIVLTLYFAGRSARGRQVARRSASSLVTLLVGFALVVGVIGLLSPNAVQNVVGSDPIQRLTRPDSSGRNDIWKAGYLACERHCDHGIGIGNFVAAYNETFPFSGATGNIGLNRPAHNTYLQIAVETGFVGLALLLVALASEWAALSMAPAREIMPAQRAALAALLIAEVFLTAIWFKFFWLLIAVDRAIEAAPEQESVASESPGPDGLPPTLAAPVMRRAGVVET
nr:O-antigen ligase family protein [Actinomycetota bacterium]